MSMTRHAALLAAFTFVCTGAIVLVQQLTQPRIDAEEDAAFARLLAEVLPLAKYDNNIAKDCVSIVEPEVFGRARAMPVYRARRANNPVALVFTATAPDGYSGDIDLLIAIYANGEIAGTRVTSHKETPGLGDKIERRKSDWIEQFRGLSLEKPVAEKWAVSKDGGEFDGFTGATITPRAVIASLRRVQHYHFEHQTELFSAVSNCQASSQK